jgi:Tol biopolymer transport system component
MRLSPKIFVAVLIGALLALPGAAHAAYPGGNGKIAFVRDGQVWTINPDGTGEAQLTSDASPSADPEWSPDGTRIAYSRNGTNGSEVRVMNADGSNDHRLYAPPGAPEQFAPSWSPDGRRIAFAQPTIVCCFFIDWVVTTVDSDGSKPGTAFTDQTAATFRDLEWSPRGDELGFTMDHPDVGETDAVLLDLRPSGGLEVLTIDPDETSAAPSWSPDAGRLAVLSDLGVVDYEVWTMNRDGTGREQITNSGAKQFGLEWSPDGSKLVLSSGEVGCSGDCDAGLQLMNPDGSGSTMLVDTASSEISPDWQPAMGALPPGYPRPRGATPMTLSLVPAYVPCTAPNRTHGAPLAFGSCATPGQSSPYLTVGTPDANGAPVRMSGSLRIAAIAGNESTEANEANAVFTFSLTDVRCYAGDTRSVCAGSNTQGGRDYTGGLRVRISLRLTDRYNLPAPAGKGPGTMTDAPIELDLPACSPTPSDPSAGSTCSFTTTTAARRLLGVTEGRRAVMELGQVEVLDGGASGNVNPGQPSSGMSTFLRQGLFIP